MSVQPETATPTPQPEPSPVPPSEPDTTCNETIVVRLTMNQFLPTAPAQPIQVVNRRWWLEPIFIFAALTMVAIIVPLFAAFSPEVTGYHHSHEAVLPTVILVVLGLAFARRLRTLMTALLILVIAVLLVFVAFVYAPQEGIDRLQNALSELWYKAHPEQRPGPDSYYGQRREPVVIFVVPRHEPEFQPEPPRFQLDPEPTPPPRKGLKRFH